MVTLRSGTPCTDVIMGVDNPGRARRWISVSSRLAGAGRSEGVIVSFVDVTARVQREHMLNLLTDVNRYVMFAADEAELLQHLCDGLVQEVAVPAGREEVTFSYDPPGLDLGLGASAAGLAIVAVLALVALGSRRGSPRGRPSPRRHLHAEERRVPGSLLA